MNHRARDLTQSGVKALAITTLLLAAACGGSSGELELARKHMRRGDLAEAERALVTAEGSDVERLREEIADAKGARDEFLGELAAANERETAAEAAAALKALVGEAPDPYCEEKLDIARSKIADRAAMERSSKPMRLADQDEREWQPEELIVQHGGGEVSARSEAQREQVNLVIESVEDLRARKQWEVALLELEMALPSAGTRAAEVQALARAISQEAKMELEVILASAKRIEDSEGVSSARSFLLKHTGRFPGAGELSSIHDEVARVTKAIGLRTQLERGEIEVAVREPVLKDADDAWNKAQTLEAAGELRLAMDAWIDAGFSVGPGDERDGLVGRARALERRILYRDEVTDAWKLDAGRFEEEGFSSISAEAVTQGGEELPWAELSGEVLRDLGELAKISKRAQGGLLLERLATGTDEDALADLGRWVERGNMRSAEAWSLVATSLGEEVPEGGYVFDEGGWLPLGQFEAERLAANLDRYKKELLVATSENREEALARLLDLGSDAEPVVIEVLNSRWERALRTVQRGGVLDSLSGMADKRRALDRARATALELIFDEEEYFYPYNPPECPPDKARLYPAVQRRVDELVKAVEEVWEDSREVRLPEMFLSGLEDLLWLREVASDELELDLSMRSQIPGWIWGIDPEQESVTLQSFAWDADEAYDLAMSQEVVAYNEHLWDTFKPDGKVLDGGGLKADKAEAEQVRITNRYRAMMGRGAVAWNPQVQAAAVMHSEYMADTGDFGHFEQGDPKRRTPGDRMTLCGYAAGVSENCYMGSGSPLSAHQGWMSSSGHHRNLLGAGHREMGSGVISNYWTQNFGRGTDFLNDLQTWRD
ncbi:MAG: CAP domain-containing protein [Planctomycetes bacterium]|nr:CAP domain-containing protein [Planctomycetota bacterium]